MKRAELAKKRSKSSPKYHIPLCQEMNDKDTKNGRKRNTKKDMRVPVDPLDKSCPGGTLYKYVQSLAPHQKRFYTYLQRETTGASLANWG